RQRSAEHGPAARGGRVEHRSGEGLGLVLGQPGAGRVDLRRRAVVLGEREIDSQPALDRHGATRKPERLERADERLVVGRGQHGGHRDSVRVQDPGDVDPLAARIVVSGTAAHDTAALQRLQQADEAVDRGIGCDGDDHDALLVRMGPPSHVTCGSAVWICVAFDVVFSLFYATSWDIVNRMVPLATPEGYGREVTSVYSGTAVVPGIGVGPAVRPAPRPTAPDGEAATDASTTTVAFGSAAAEVARRLRERSQAASGAAAEVLAATAGLAEDRGLATFVSKHAS